MKAVKTALAIFGILLFQPLLALEAPKIVEGDYLLVYARLVDCGSGLQAIEAGQVDEDGDLTLFGDVSLKASERPLIDVRNELVNVMERRTGHRSATLKLVHVPGSDKEIVANRLVMFSMELKLPCPPTGLPPTDADPNWVKRFKSFVYSPHNQLFKADALKRAA